MEFISFYLRVKVSPSKSNQDGYSLRPKIVDAVDLTMSGKGLVQRPVAPDHSHQHTVRVHRSCNAARRVPHVPRAESMHSKNLLVEEFHIKNIGEIHYVENVF